MKIQSIKLDNFRCFHDVLIDKLGMLNFFGGRNGAGKSTIVDAISFALTGTCRGAETGRNLEELRTVTNGTTKGRAKVALDLGEDGRIERNDDEGPKAAKQKSLEAHFSLTSAAIRACLYAGELLRLSKKEAQALILDLLPRATVDLTDEIQKALSQAGFARMAKADLPLLDRLYKEVYEKRREVGRLLKALGEIGQEPEAPDWIEGSHMPGMPEYEGFDPAGIRIGIADKTTTLRKERDEKLLAWKEAEGKLNASADKLKRAHEAMAEVNRDLEKSMTPDAIRDEARKLLKQQTDRAELNREIEENRSKLNGEISVLESTYQDLVVKIGHVEAAKGKCPTCEQAMTASAKTKLHTAMTDRKDAISRQLQKARGDLAATSAPQSLGEIERKLSDLEGKEQTWVRLNERQKALHETIQMTGGQLANNRVAAPDTVALDERIVVGEDRLAEIDRYRGLLSAYERSKTEQGVAKKEQDVLEELVQTFGPEGIRLQLAATPGLDEFQEAIREDLERMGFTLDLGPLLALVDDPTVNGRPARFLSTSEGLRFSMAFACAVATWSKLGIVCADAWDMLDEQSGPLAGSALYAHDHLQRFVFFTPKKGLDKYIETAIELNKPEGIRYYVIERMAEKGSIVELPLPVSA